MYSSPLNAKTVLEIDGYLEPNVPAIVKRHDAFRKWKDTIKEHEGGYEHFSKGYQRFGINVDANGQVTYREWAPNAIEAYLIGDFSMQISVALLTLLIRP